MKINLLLTDPSVNFLFGLSVLNGEGEDMESGETFDIKILSLGFILFEVVVFWKV